MKIIIALFSAATILTLTGCASMEEADRLSIQMKTMEERITATDARVQRMEQSRQDQRNIDTTRYCLKDGLAFSEGAIHQGKICERQTGMMVFKEGRAVVYPLVWNPWKYQ